MNKPKVSIIIPVYNGKDYIEECVESILNGDLKEIEAIIVDDASTDNTLEILKELQLKDDRITIIHLNENHRQGGARNIGIKAAKSDLIAFVDADDWVDKAIFEKAYLLQKPNDYDIVAFNIINHFSEEKIELDAKYSKSDDFTENKKLLFIKSPAPCQAIYKKELFTEDSLFPENTFYEDVIITAIYLKAQKIGIIEEGLYHYRRDNESTCRKRNDLRYFERVHAMDIFIDRVKSLNLENRYSDELEFMYIKITWLDSIIGATYNFDVLPKDTLFQIYKHVNAKFPNFLGNKYLKTLGLKRRLLLKLYGYSFGLGCLFSKALIKFTKH